MVNYPAIEITEEKKVRDCIAYRTLTMDGKEGILLSWNIYVPNEDEEVTGFNIYRAVGTDFQLLSTGVTNDFYLDIYAEMRFGAEYHYKITYLTVKEESSFDNAILFGLYTGRPEGFQGRAYWILMEYARRNQWLLSNFGEVVKIFIKKRIGIRCTDCWNEVTERPTDPRCQLCYGTGFIGGYEKFDGRSLVLPFEEFIKESIEGRIKQVTPRVVFGSYPKLNEEDIIVKQNNEKLMISRVSPFYYQMFLIYQEVSSSMLPVGHPAYLLDG